MKHTIAEIKEGEQVWMYIPDLHVSRPLLVTVSCAISDTSYMIPFVYITVHEREGMCGNPGCVLGSMCSACSECYDTEEEAQEVIDCNRKREAEKKEKLKNFYSKVAEEYYNGNIECGTEEQAAYFKAGFVEACMELRNRDYLLKVNPPVQGIESISRENDLWNRYMKENN